jgi:TolB-like protein
MLSRRVTATLWATAIAARLEGIGKPGAICLSEDAYRQLRGKLDLAVSDLGPIQLKNIAEPIRIYSLEVAARLPTTSAPAQLPLPDRPSIAVLPFQNMSGDPEQEYFADGMVEDILTGLSRIKWLFVIARNSSFVYKGKAVDVRQVGRELGVRYVLEGAVRKAGDRLRITAQLLEAETGAHLWADKYDGKLEDIFDVQDQITEKVVGIVEPSLQRSEIERSRRKHPENLEAYDLYLRALPHMASVMPADARIAAGLLEDALKLDPDYAAARAFLAWCHEICFTRGGFSEADKIAALRHAHAAIASGTDDATGLGVAAFVIGMLSKDHRSALNAIERALSLNPSSTTALYWGAVINAMHIGNFATATAYANRALRLSPFDQTAFCAHLALAFAAVSEGRYDEAASHSAKAVQNNPRFGFLYFYQAIALALAGRVDEARPIVEKGWELEPGIRIRDTLERVIHYPPLTEKLLQGARLLGSPE